MRKTQQVLHLLTMRQDKVIISEVHSTNLLPTTQMYNLMLLEISFRQVRLKPMSVVGSLMYKLTTCICLHVQINYMHMFSTYCPYARWHVGQHLADGI